MQSVSDDSVTLMGNFNVCKHGDTSRTLESALRIYVSGKRVFARKILTPGNRVTRVMAHIDVSLYNSFIIISHDIMFICRITLCELAISGNQLGDAIGGRIIPFHDY